MRDYKNLQGQSGVKRYAIADDAMLVEFNRGGIYLYTAAMIGEEKLEQMKQLAEIGQGLNTFISRHVDQAFSHRFD
ncbi:hypothetical protein [Thiofilum flexile]|uniref:hypothetical protein n=1 Tax=Thiofilum flexile TaxID=125627 RepID=UPI000367AC15|nr:hypothetical protein [Thiofilum flexile]